MLTYATGQTFCNNFAVRSSKDHSCVVLSNGAQQFRRSHLKTFYKTHCKLLTPKLTSFNPGGHNLNNFGRGSQEDVWYLWWLICAMSYKHVFGAKTRKVATPKLAKWWLFRVFAWRPFAPPHKSMRHSMRCVFGYCLSYLCLAGRNVAKRKNAPKSPFGGFLHGGLSRFRPEKPAYTTWHKSATIETRYETLGLVVSDK